MRPVVGLLVIAALSACTPPCEPPADFVDFTPQVTAAAGEDGKRMIYRHFVSPTFLQRNPTPLDTTELGKVPWSWGEVGGRVFFKADFSEKLYEFHAVSFPNYEDFRDTRETHREEVDVWSGYFEPIAEKDGFFLGRNGYSDGLGYIDLEDVSEYLYFHIDHYKKGGGHCLERSPYCWMHFTSSKNGLNHSGFVYMMIERRDLTHWRDMLQFARENFYVCQEG